MPSPDYEVLNHTADIGLRARGATVEDAFLNMARGMMSLIVSEGTRILVREERKIEAEAASLEGLLVAWLSELVYLIDAERFLPGEIGRPRICRGGCGSGSRGGDHDGDHDGYRDGDRDGDHDGGDDGCVRGDSPVGPPFEAGASPSCAAWTISASVRGERIDPERHRMEMEIKGVSYHLLKVASETRAGAGGDQGSSGGWVAQAIFDV